MDPKNVKVFIACHKSCDVPSDSIYLPLQVGAKGKKSIGFERDDSGKNISEKNPVFCELTGLYWVWKNLDCDYVGLVHYRRYFTQKRKSYQKKYGQLESALTTAEANELLDRFPILVPKKRNYYISTIYNHYDSTFDGKQLDIARDIVRQKYPEYLDSFDWYMKQKKGYVFNMYIMKKAYSDAYCEWLFDILFELEKRIDLSHMSAFEKRYAGRVSERLFNVWLHYQLVRRTITEDMVHEVPYLYIGEVNWSKKVKGFLTAKFFHKKYDQSF